MNDIAAILACFAACLLWAAWRENRVGNFRDRTLLAGVGIAFSSASAVVAVLA